MSESRGPAPTELPLRHAVIPAFKLNGHGLTVPCDGPNLMTLGDDGKPHCAECDGLLVRSDV